MEAKHICTNCGAVVLWTAGVGDKLRCPHCGGHDFRYGGKAEAPIHVEDPSKHKDAARPTE